MKKTVLIMMLSCFAMASMAQDISKQREVGITFSSLNNFGINYKVGNGLSMWRFNSLFGKGDKTERNSDSLISNVENFDLGISIGKEYRNQFADKLEFIYGLDFGVSYSKDFSTSNDKSIYNNDSKFEEKTYSPSVSIVFGVNYMLKNNIYIGAELKPYFKYNIGERTVSGQNNSIEEVKTDISGIEYGFNNNSAMLSIGYRF